MSETFTRLPDWLMQREDLSLGAKVTWARLRRLAGHKGEAHPRLSTLGEALGIPERTLRRYLGELEEGGWISTVQRGKKRANAYRIFDQFTRREPESDRPKWPLTAAKMADHSGQIGRSVVREVSKRGMEETEYKKSVLDLGMSSTGAEEMPMAERLRLAMEAKRERLWRGLPTAEEMRAELPALSAGELSAETVARLQDEHVRLIWCERNGKAAELMEEAAAYEWV